jgi:hypothetical protein
MQSTIATINFIKPTVLKHPTADTIEGALFTDSITIVQNGKVLCLVGPVGDPDSMADAVRIAEAMNLKLALDEQVEVQPAPKPAPVTFEQALDALDALELFNGDTGASVTLRRYVEENQPPLSATEEQIEFAIGVGAPREFCSDPACGCRAFTLQFPIR